MAAGIWFLHKHNLLINTDTVNGASSYRKQWEINMCSLDSLVNCVVPFGQLKNINYIKELYAYVNNTHLTNDAVERINYNIKINNKLLIDLKNTISR